VKCSFAVKGGFPYLLGAAGENLQAGPIFRRSPMRNGLYLDVLERGSPLAVKAASVAAAAVLFLLVALPVLAVGVRVIA
jgi:hypothetical protein